MPEPTPTRPALPVAELPPGRKTTTTVGVFGQALEGWIVGNRLAAMTVLVDAAHGRQTLILRFTDGHRDLNLVVKDRATFGLGLSIMSSCIPRYLDDLEIAELLAARRAGRAVDGAAVEFGLTSVPTHAALPPAPKPPEPGLASAEERLPAGADPVDRPVVERGGGAEKPAEILRKEFGLEQGHPERAPQAAESPTKSGDHEGAR